MLSGIVFVNRNGLRWRDAPRTTARTRRCTTVGSAGRGRRVHADDGGLAAADAEPNTVMIDATYLKVHRTASSLRVKKGSRPPDRRTKGGMNTKSMRRRRERAPVELFHDSSQVSDYTVRQRCSMICQKHSGCSVTAAMMQTGSGTPCMPKASSPASQAENLAINPQIRQAPLPTTQPHRDDVRPLERLAPRRDPL